MRRFEGQVILVSGAASGIGRATAEAFAAEGARLSLIDIDQERLAATVKSLALPSGSVLQTAGDACNETTVQNVTEKTFATYGRMDVLMNSVGIDLRASITETSSEDWDRIMSVNVRPIFLTCKFATVLMMRTGGGCIVNIASAAGLVPIGGRPAYNASKAAVIALTKSLALDLAPKIRANCICPGAVETPLLMEAIRTSSDPDAALNHVIDRYPLKRISQPCEIAQAALFLASREAAYITGTALPVDGGRTLH